MATRVVDGLQVPLGVLWGFFLEELREPRAFLPGHCVGSQRSVLETGGEGL